jgi:acyl-CoA synthetase (AMP-forming)/AMP-acid ligase II
VYLEAFTPEGWVATARDEAITHAMVVPTMLGRILDVLERDGGRLPALRHLSYGGGRMPTPVVERALALLPHVAFVNAYGLTETSSTISVLGPDDHRTAVSSDDPRVRARLGSVGRPLPGLEVTVRDAGGEEVPPGEQGEVWVRGDQVAGEYLG